jgi:hypothetical protein
MRYHRLSVTHLATLSTSYHVTLWSAGIATLKIPAASYTMHDPRVWLLHNNRQQLSELLERAFRDRYASYTEEAVPLLNQALLVRVFGFAHPTHKGASLFRCQRFVLETSLCGTTCFAAHPSKRRDSWRSIGPCDRSNHGQGA